MKMEVLHMTQKRDKRMQPEKYYSLRNLDRIDWANIEQLYVRPATDDDARSEGCYENQGKVLLVGAEDGQIRNIVDLCGSKLRVLDIKGSMLSGLHLGYMFNLRNLLLQDCSNLTSLPGLENLMQLNELNLQGCDYLTALPGLENLTQLNELNLQGCNRLTALPGLENLTWLTYLDLSCCIGFAKLPEGIRYLRSLRRLDLNDLNLEELPDWLPEIAEKFTLGNNIDDGNEKAIVSLADTIVEGVDMSIFEQPYEMVVEWFEKRKAGRTQPLNEIKVVFLGDGEAGKSHTIARLMNDGGDPIGYVDVRTPGIVIKNKSFPVGNRDATLHFWDFGGQDIMHSMHRIFLTGRTMYVVLLNARDDTQGDRAKYWLHNIKSFAPDAPVLLVLNKIDQNPNASVDEVDLRGRYDKLTKIVRLSALKYSQEEFTEKFTEVLLEEIKNTGYLDAQWPAAWVKVKEQLENMDSHYILGDAYQAICETCEVNDNQKNLLHWFNDLGVSFSFCDPEDYSLNQYVILRPEWITNALYIILFNKLEGTQNGLIPHASIHRILKSAHNNSNILCTLPKARYSGNDIQYVLGVMRKFNLSFPYGTDHEFIPMLCQLNSTVDIHYYEKDENTLEFHMEFEYLPNNLLHRLMVERHSELDLSNVWRTGAIFQQLDLGLSAVVMIDGDTLKLYIRHRNDGYKPNTYLHMLKVHIERIRNKMGLPEPINKIIYKADGRREHFSYEMLTGMVEAGQSAVYSIAFRRMIPISDILSEAGLHAEEGKQMLLSAVAKACIEMQQEPQCWEMSEDARNRRLRDSLELLGYDVHDQSQWGASRKGMRPGEIDLIIYKEDKQPWAACDMLSVNQKDDIRKWNDHLTKIMTSYHTRELPLQFLISFAECDRSEYQQLWSVFNDHMRKYDPRHGRPMGQYLHILPLPELPEYLRVAQLSYDVGGTAVTVYHYFVHMGGTYAKDSQSADEQKERLESTLAEIARLREHLKLQEQEKRMVEIAAQKAQIELKNVTSRQDAQIAELQNALSQTHREADSAQLRIAELEQIRAQAEAYAAEIEILRSTQDQLNAERIQLHDEIQHIQKMLADADYSAQLVSEERDHAIKRTERQAAEIAELRSRLEILVKEQRTEVENDRKAEEITHLLARLEQKQRDLRETEAAAMEAVKKHRQMDALVADLEHREMEIQAAREKARDAVNHRRELEVLYADSKKKQLEAQEAVLNAQKENALLAAQAVESTKQIQKLEQKLRSINAEAADGMDETDEETAEEVPNAKKEYRVIILGDSEAGKSQILYRLRHPNRKPERFPGDVTPGIDIASRCFDIGGEPVRVNFWDFGGQEILHSLHRLFLAKNTMYVIVLNTRNDNQDDQAKFWLHYVELYAKGAPVILVLNKIDQNPTASLNLPVLERLFDKTAVIMDVLPLAAKIWSKEKFQQEFVDKLRDHISTVMDETNSFTDEELQIRDQIRTQNKDQQIVQMSEFRRICLQGNLPKGSDYIKLAERFHKAGMLVYFGTRTNMIKDPDWITDAIYKILEQGVTRASNGIIDYETIEEIMYDDVKADYQKSQIDFVMKIMRKYGLSFQYQAPINNLPEQEFIPVLCRHTEPTDIQGFITDVNVIQMEMIFRYLPAGVLYQLMVDLKLEMCKENVWLSGAMFKNNYGCTAVVIREKDRMAIYVQGENRVLALRYMESIRERVEGIARGDMYNANVEQTLLGYYIADRGEVEFFDYDRLSLSKERNLNYAMSKRKPGALIVRDILDQRDGAYIQERDTLLQLVLRGCKAIQKDKVFREADENTRNRELARMIQAALTPKDQTEGGDSGTGIGLGELDIEILNERGMPIAILEGLDTTSINTAYWRNHLDKLMGNYNTSGLRYLILTSYVPCPKSKFLDKFKETANHWQKVEPMGFEGCLEGADTVVMEDCPELIRITRADYIRNGFKVSLYHFLVHIGGAENETDPNAVDRE